MTKSLKRQISNQIIHGKGYCTNIKISKRELKSLRNIVESHLNKKINENLKEGVRQKKINLERLHLLTNKVDYKNFISQKNRILDINNYKKIIKFHFYKKIKKIFGPFKQVSNGPFAQSFGQFVVRVVRPGAYKSDIGSLHADIWFFLLKKKKKYYPKLMENERNIKFWIPICLEKNKSGLLVSENSQKESFNFKGQLYAKKKGLKKQNETKGHLRPIFDYKNNPKPKLKLLNINPGTVVIFTEKLLHGGTNLKASKTRVSLEFSIIIKKQNLS